jgi:hypothetical protein
LFPEIKKIREFVRPAVNKKANEHHPVLLFNIGYKTEDIWQNLPESAEYRESMQAKFGVATRKFKICPWRI